jgi:hypothetical protein
MPWPTEDPEAYFAERGFALHMHEDPDDGDWAADLVSQSGGRTLQVRYGSGESPDDAALSAQRRYHVEQEGEPPLPRRLP